MAMYYLAILDNEYTESGEPGWIVEGPFPNAKVMMENLQRTLSQAAMARKVLFLRNVNLIDEDS